MPHNAILIFMTVLSFTFLNNLYAGVDFRSLSGEGTALRQETQRLVDSVKARNKDLADIAYERIKEILRNLPDKGRNAELLNQYLAILEKIREISEKNDDVLISAKQSQDMFDQIQGLVASQRGAHVCMSSEIVKKDYTDSGKKRFHRFWKRSNMIPQILEKITQIWKGDYTESGKDLGRRLQGLSKDEQPADD